LGVPGADVGPLDAIPPLDPLRGLRGIPGKPGLGSGSETLGVGPGIVPPEFATPIDPPDAAPPLDPLCGLRGYPSLGDATSYIARSWFAGTEVLEQGLGVVGDGAGSLGGYPGSDG